MPRPTTSPAPMERNDGFRSLLSMAPVYRLAQRAIGSHRSSRRLADEVLRTTSDSVVIDLGCGTADILDFIDVGTYVGVDPNPSYVAEANRRVGSRGEVIEARIGDEGLRARLPSSADLVMMMGVLHHLDDELAHASLALAAELVGTTGRFVSFDPGRVDGQPKLARFLADRDRGQHVRDVEATGRLMSAHFPHVEIAVHHDFLAIPYTHILVSASSGTSNPRAAER